MSENDASKIIIDDSRVMLQIVASLSDNSRGVIYDCIMFIVLFTGNWQSSECSIHFDSVSIIVGNTNWSGTVDLLIKVACFVQKVKNIFNIKRTRSKIVSTRRSTVLSLPLQWDFPDHTDEYPSTELFCRMLSLPFDRTLIEV